MSNQALTTVSNLEPHALHQRLLESIAFTKTGFVVIGKLLYELNKDDNFLDAVGEGIDTWDDYISQPEISLSRGEANRLMQIYEEFVLKIGLTETELSEIPVKNLHYILPMVKKGLPKEQLDVLIDDARHLAQKDFKEKVYETKHDTDERTYEYMVMKRCIETGVLTKVHDITSEQIINNFAL